MGDVWQIGQKMSGDEFYNKAEKLPYPLKPMKDIIAANKLTCVCQAMLKTYNDIQEDQNEYLIEIEDINNEISDIEGDLKAQIEKLEAEITELEIKKENGTITEQEEAELASKKSELGNLQAQYENEIENSNKELDKTSDKAQNSEHKSKKEIATSYGKTAVNKGNELASTEDRTKTVLRRIFNSWSNADIREAGEKLAVSGSELLDKVGACNEIDKKITESKEK